MGLDHLDDALLELERGHLLRRPRSHAALHPDAVWLCSNDYLGLADRETEAAGPGGAGASALVWGYGPAHEAAERALSTYAGVESCLLFSSGYAANVGVVSAIAGRGDLVVSDALNHASLVDGCRLSGARVAVVPHLDLDALDDALTGAARRRFYVTESYFSMDGDGPDLREVASICARRGAALLVDEAHALGVLGPGGRGRCAEAGIVPDVLVGTLGKSFGLAGAFVGGSASLRTWLWNRARSFVFSTAVPPATAAAAAARVAEVAAADEARARLDQLTRRMRARLADETGSVPPGFGPIIPVPLGRPDLALSLAQRLLEEGWVVQPMRPPTVPEGGSRLRVTVRATLREEQVDAAARAIGRGLRELGSSAPPAGRADPSLSYPPVVAVTGTGTEIGKTHVASSLVRLLVGRGIRVAGRKPIESGVTGGQGADQAALEVDGSLLPDGPAPFRFSRAVSPHLAAREEGRTIEVDAAVEWALAGPATVRVVEAAGALLSPLGPGVTNLDLLVALRPDAIVLVAPDRLGVLHDVAAVRGALEQRGLWTRTVVVLSAPSMPDASTGTNAAELAALGTARRVVSWPRRPVPAGRDAAAPEATLTWEALEAGAVGRFT